MVQRQGPGLARRRGMGIREADGPKDWQGSENRGLAMWQGPGIGEAAGSGDW